MPIVIPESAASERLCENLGRNNVPHFREAEAAQRDIRPARIGLLNLMPAEAMPATETQWLRWMGFSVLQIEPVLIKFDDDDREREGASREDILSTYQPFSEAAETGLDGLIVTGDNLEIDPEEGLASVKALELDKIRYAKKLNTLIQWTRQNVSSTIYSCLGAHYALNYLYDLPRVIEPDKPKTFGVYQHEVTDPDNPFVHDMNRTIISPHSRWGNVSPELIEKTGDLKILAQNENIGWLLVEGENQAGGKDLFIQGHPEYYIKDLHREYLRDMAEYAQDPSKNRQPNIPQNYYIQDVPGEDIDYNWITDARSLHGNYVNLAYDRFSRPTD